ncbi:MAG: glycosyl transferase family 1 [Blastopirellula sp.]|nr:MAG: glycosyl transferase family 1 [Blastopirellula sp.]
MTPTHIVYASFDRFPSPKGAATHIEAFISALGQRFGNVDLITIPSENLERFDQEKEVVPSPDLANRISTEHETNAPVWSATGVTHHPLLSPGDHLFERVLSYRSQIWNWWRRRFFDANIVVPVVHFRSIYEGYPIARQKDLFCRQLVFEVNGLPSIELKYRYPRVAEDEELLHKLRHQEQVCLEAADLILTVSQVNAEHLISRGVAASRICVIPNGVDLEMFSYQEPQEVSRDTLSEERPLKMLYSGTMSAWQGVTVAMESLALLRRDFPATLTMVGHASTRQKKELLNRAWELGVYDHVHILDPVDKPTLVELHHQADVIVAPLTRNDRNLVQGCCPLKVLEAMASGTPLIASDLPVVRELATNEVQALLVRPGSAKSLKDGMLRLILEPNEGQRLSLAARAHVEENYSWDRAKAALIAAYEGLAAVAHFSDNLDSSSPSRSASTPS